MRIAILGPFGTGQKLRNGQTIKAQNLADGLRDYTTNDVKEIDTYGWNDHPFRLYRTLRREAGGCDAVIMLPAHNGVKVFSPLLVRLKKRKHIKIFYDVVGGWLPDLLGKDQRLEKALKSFDGIWVETSTLGDRMQSLNFGNIAIVPNFKKLHHLDTKDLEGGKPFRLCTFSRVSIEKGIETAVNAVKEINREFNDVVYTLDIYGAIDKGQEEWFQEMQRSFPDFIKYKGCADPDESTEILKNYFALLFPTHHYTEGLPGTIIDAYAAGVPVISARWESYSDLIIDGKTGIGYKFDDDDDFKRVLKTVAENPQELIGMRENCMELSEKFNPETVIKRIMGLINGDRIAAE